MMGHSTSQVAEHYLASLDMDKTIILTSFKILPGFLPGFEDISYKIMEV